MMDHTRLTVRITDTSLPAALILTADELAAAVGISTEWLAHLVRAGVVEPSGPEANEFTAATAVRLRRMLRLRADLGISWISASIIVDLVERMDRLEAELAHRRAESGS